MRAGTTCTVFRHVPSRTQSAPPSVTPRLHALPISSTSLLALHPRRSRASNPMESAQQCMDDAAAVRFSTMNRRFMHAHAPQSQSQPMLERKCRPHSWSRDAVQMMIKRPVAPTKAISLPPPSGSPPRTLQTSSSSLPEPLPQIGRRDLHPPSPAQASPSPCSPRTPDGLVW